MNTNLILWIFVDLVGIVVLLAITAGVVFWLRKVTQSAISYLLEDEKVADAGSKLVLFLAAFQGLEAVLRYITQEHLDFLLSSWIGLANSLIGVVQWAIQIAALLFIGYAIKKRKSA
jgi:hypothetical protein